MLKISSHQDQYFPDSVLHFTVVLKINFDFRQKKFGEGILFQGSICIYAQSMYTNHRVVKAWGQDECRLEGVNGEDKGGIVIHSTIKICFKK